MNPNAEQFTAQHLRFFRAIKCLHQLPLPGCWKLRLARMISAQLSPWSFDQAQVAAHMQEALGVDAKKAKNDSQLWAQSYGQFALTVFDYPKLTRQFSSEQVHVIQPEVFSQLVKTGGLLLTYHSFHHHTLFVILAMAGLRINVVAASEKNAPDRAVMGAYTRLINGGSEHHFRGGQYFFTDEKKELVQGIKTALAQHDCVAVLCDNWDPTSTLEPIHLLNRQIKVGSSVLRLASQAQPPVYAAIAYPHPKQGWVLQCKSLGTLEKFGEQNILVSYFEFLEEVLHQAPWAWQGWAWFDFLMKSSRLRLV